MVRFPGSRFRAVCLGLAATGVLVMLLAATGFAATGLKIYICNKAYQGKKMTQKKVLFLPVGAYAEAMGLKKHSAGKAWCLSDVTRGDDRCTLQESPELVLYVNGTLVKDALVESNGETWLDAKRVTQNLGGWFMENRSLGILDISRRSMPAKIPNQSAEKPVEARAVMVFFTAGW